MTIYRETLNIQTRGRGLLEVTDAVREVVFRSGLREGQCTVFCQHTSASLLIQENADPSAAADIEAFFDRLAPDGDPRLQHVAEGPDDSPAHLRSAVTRSAEVMPLIEGGLALGTWQGLYLFEHRLAPHSRRLLVQVMGE